MADEKGVLELTTAHVIFQLLPGSSVHDVSQML
jgi:hypothetical protein